MTGSKEGGGGGRVSLLLGADQSISIGPGDMILVEETEGDAYGAVLVKVDGCWAELTFTPPGRPRRVPLGVIVCSISKKSDNIELSSIPDYQPAPTILRDGVGG